MGAPFLQGDTPAVAAVSVELRIGNHCCVAIYWAGAGMPTPHGTSLSRARFRGVRLLRKVILAPFS